VLDRTTGGESATLIALLATLSFVETIGMLDYLAMIAANDEVTSENFITTPRYCSDTV